MRLAYIYICTYAYKREAVEQDEEKKRVIYSLGAEGVGEAGGLSSSYLVYGESGCGGPVVVTGVPLALESMSSEDEASAPAVVLLLLLVLVASGEAEGGGGLGEGEVGGFKSTNAV